MVRSVILIKSCARDRANGNQQASKDTWVKEWGGTVPVKYILGQGNENPGEDEVILNSPDEYNSLWKKTLEAIKWTLHNDYDYSFHACTDTYIHVPRLLDYGYTGHDYVGFRLAQGHASGGAGYWLSRRAAEKLALSCWKENWEDLEVYEILSRHKISLQHSNKFCPHTVQPNFYTVHLSTDTGNFDPMQMHNLHNESK